jgi:hypothetical protein
MSRLHDPRVIPSGTASTALHGSAIIAGWAEQTMTNLYRRYAAASHHVQWNDWRGPVGEKDGKFRVRFS